MSVIPSITAGDDIEASWGDAVATAINSTTRTTNASFTTTETQCIGRTFAAGTLAAGTMVRLTAWLTITSTASNVCTFRVRIGSTTLTGTIATNIAPTATTSASDHGVLLTADVTIRSTGAGGTAIAGISFVAVETQPFTVGHRTNMETSTITVDTTATKIIEMTAVAAAGTTTIVCRQASVQVIAP